MPFVSRQQSKFFHWADEHPAEASKRGLKPSTVHEFIDASHGQKVRDLPERVEHKAEGGSVGRPQFRW